MSSTNQPSGERASQLLNFNMKNISHELSTLLTGGELDGSGAMRNDSKSGIAINPSAYWASAINQLESGVLICDAQNEHILNRNENQKLHLYLEQYHQQHLCQQNNYNPLSTFMGNKNGNYTIATQPTWHKYHDAEKTACIITGGVTSNLPTTPKFEFHFLRCQSTGKSSSDVNSIPLISSAARNQSETDLFNLRRSCGGAGFSRGICTGARKFTKQQTSCGSNEGIAYDKILVDIYALGLSEDIKEVNPVLRLFGIFRKMHYYLNEALGETFVIEYRHLTQTKYYMPCTMNVQFQVKHAARKCTMFLSEMQQIMNLNIIYNPDLILECEKSLSKLRKLLTQVEAFRRVEMEHKRGQFVTEDSQVQSQKLEKLLKLLNDQIREAHLFVHSLNWAIDRINHKAIFGEIKHPQIGISSDYGGAHINSAKCDIPNETPINANSDTVELLSSAANDNLAISFITASCNETESERQSTRYIGYK